MTVKNYEWAIEQAKEGKTVARKDWAEYEFIAEETILTEEEAAKVERLAKKDPDFELTFEYYEALAQEKAIVLTSPIKQIGEEALFLACDRWEPTEEDLAADDYEIVTPEFPVPDEYLEEQGQE